MNEHERALMEAHMAATEDDYFHARPQIDNHDRRAVFQAGFRRAWEICARQTDLVLTTTSGHARGLADLTHNVEVRGEP